MTLRSDRWHRVEELCDRALTLDPGERQAFLASACAGDEELRREVESLLSHESKADGFLKSSTLRAMAHDVMSAPQGSLMGRRIGAYEVRTWLGAGGMGEVYRARDTVLGRDVAIKVLSPGFVADPERLVRFEREARVLAALNHPHIGAIYGVEQVDGARALILELIEGGTLATRIARGPLPLDEALRVGRQIAEALQAAHEKGIVHRDLKPSNIAITASGTVKVLDFGLAKGGDPAAADPAQSRTVFKTGDGVLVGTAAYMSPEQARGQPVDKRTDIWAFGCVLYEMLTGRQAFGGETVSDLIVAIIEREPDWTALSAAVPQAIRRVLERSLNKDAKRRLHDIADALLELDEAAEPVDVKPRASKGRGARLAWTLAFTAAAIAAVVTWQFRNDRATPASAPVVTRAVVPLPSNLELPNDWTATVVVSPDGKYVVYRAARPDGPPQLYYRSIDQLTATPIPQTEDASRPFFSSDGRWLAFQRVEQGIVRLKKVAISGGAPETICDCGLRGGTWSDDGTIVFTQDSNSGLSRVPASGGVPQPLTTPDRARGEKNHRFVEVLPGGKALLMTVTTSDLELYDDARIELLVLATGERRVLIRGGMVARYLATGHIVYARAGSLLAVPFDLQRLQVMGSPVTVVDGVLTDPVNGVAAFSVSNAGSLFYVSGGVAARYKSVVWVSRDGRSTPAADIHRAITWVRLSPDERRVGFEVNGVNTTIWIYDFQQTTMSRLMGNWDNFGPIWSPDGRQLAFASTRTDFRELRLFVQAADQLQEPAALDMGPGLSPTSWSPDGKSLLFGQRQAATAVDLFEYRLDERTIHPVVRAPASQVNGAISPDGRWIAYESSHSGRSGVYVQAFHGGSRVWPVSTEGGSAPVWSRDGRDLFYRNGRWLMAAAVEKGDGGFGIRRPVRLFEGDYFPSYDVARDGRFLMLKEDPAPARQLVLVQNWFEELKAKVPAGK